MRSALLGLCILLGAQFTAPPFVVPGVLGGLSSSAMAAELDEIRARGYLIVAVKDNWYPMGFRGTSGELVGFEIDIARRLAEDLLGAPEAIRFVPVNNLERVNAVIEGEVDVAIASVTVTAARQRIADFSLPYYLDGIGFITRSLAMQTQTDLATGRIALLQSSSTLSTVRDRLPNAELLPVPSYQAALALLEADQADAFAGDVTVVTGWQQQDPQYRVLDTIISAEPLAIVLPKGTAYTPLRREINHLIRVWDDEGWLQERAAAWGLPTRDGR